MWLEYADCGDHNREIGRMKQYDHSDNTRATFIYTKWYYDNHYYSNFFLQHYDFESMMMGDSQNEQQNGSYRFYPIWMKRCSYRCSIRSDRMELKRSKLFYPFLLLILGVTQYIILLHGCCYHMTYIWTYYADNFIKYKMTTSPFPT